jgi:hypothetical protein
MRQHKMYHMFLVYGSQVKQNYVFVTARTVTLSS